MLRVPILAGRPSWFEGGWLSKSVSTAHFRRMHGKAAHPEGGIASDA
jgi:hypothetical protein